jgi:hypothetical protein
MSGSLESVWAAPHSYRAIGEGASLYPPSWKDRHSNGPSLGPHIFTRELEHSNWPASTPMIRPGFMFEAMPGSFRGEGVG